MIIDRVRKIIFVRHQKTASTSIFRSLSLAENSGFRSHQHLNHHIRPLTGKRYDGHHVPLYELKNIYPKVYKNKDEYFKFGFTRNPWDRMVSAKEYLGKLKMKAYRGAANIDRLSMEEFLKRKDWDKMWLGLNLNTVDFCRGCDFIGKFENLQEDFNLICDKIGVSPRQLPHANKTKRKSYIKYYTEETKQIVAERFAKDIEYFGYEFGE